MASRWRRSREPRGSGSRRTDIGGFVARRRGAFEVALCLPILVVLGVVAVTAGQGDPGPTAPAPTPTAIAAPSMSDEPRAEPEVEGEVGDGGIDARYANAPTVEQLTRKLKRKGLVLVDGPPARMDLSFSIASFNVLGASHTRGPNRRKRFADAGTRLPAQIRMLESKGVGIAGLQEFQGPQVRALLAIAGERYDVYPGLTLGERLADNSIIWRSDVWEAVAKQTTPVPYFRGRMVPMPQVLLRHRTTGQKVWIGNFHNPANVVGNAARWRAQAVAIEASLAKRLGADGTPVIFTGDMNDRAAFACSFTAQSDMHSADGAYTDAANRCSVPRRLNVDWILGSKKVAFTNFVTDFSSEHRRLSDHPLITATATLPAASNAKDCQIHPSTRGALWFCPRRG